MNRTRLACYSLLASAFVLAGILLVRLDTHLTTAAFADQSVTSGDFTVMTARTKSDDEALFVLDNVHARLLIIKADVNRKRLRVVEAVDLQRQLSSGGGRTVR